MNLPVLNTTRTEQEQALVDTLNMATLAERGLLAKDDSGNVFDLSSEGQKCVQRGITANDSALFSADYGQLGNLRCDAVGGSGIPTGGLTVITPKPIREKFPQYQFAHSLVPDPDDNMQARGAKNIESAIVQQTGEMRPIDAIGDNARGRIDINFQTINYRNRRFGASFVVNRQRMDQMELLSRQNGGLATVNLLLELRKGAENSYQQKRNKAFGLGLNGSRLVGLLNNPFVPRLVSNVRLNASSTSTTSAEDAIALLKAMDEEVQEQSDLAWVPTTLLLPTKTYSVNSRKYFSGVQDNVIMRLAREALISQSDNFYYDGTKRNLEIVAVPEMSQLSTTNDLALMYVRTPETCKKRETMPLTYSQPVYTTEGYEVPFDCEISGTHFDHPISAVYLEFPKN